MGYNVKIIDSIAELRNHATDWDDLWARSSVENPLALAEPIALWMERFELNLPFQAIIVEESGRLVAAFPLYGGKKAKIISAGMNPSNGWSHCGQLLVDWTKPDETPNIIEALISGVRKLPFSVLWLDEIRLENPEWLLFRDTLAQKRIPSQWLPRYCSAAFSLEGTLEELKANWKKKQVSKLVNNFEKKIEPKEGAFTILKSHSEVLEMLSKCFELENQCWKGTEGGGIIRRNMVDYMTELTSFMVSKNAMRLALLRQHGKVIAFKYCFQGKSTVYSQKTSYLPEYRELSPGQLLQYLINRELSEDVSVRHFDFVGEAGPHQMIWNSRETPTGQIVLPLNTLIGKSFFFLYDRVMPIVRKYKTKKS